jgi:hypothetical protein
MNIHPQKAQYLTTLFECKVSSFLIKYFGVPLPDRKLRKINWDILLNNVADKLPNWIGSLLSLSDILTMLNSVPSVVPLYMLSLYKMPTSIRKRMNSIRCRCF